MFCKKKRAAKKRAKEAKKLQKKGFASVLSDKRIPVPTPESIIDEDGKTVFGTFDKEFQNLNFLDIHKQSCLPDFMNKSRLTLWEACEINLDDDICILTAYSSLGGGIAGVCLTLVYDKHEKKRYAFTGITNGNGMSAGLLDGDTTEGKSFLNSVKMVNDFGNGKATVSGKGKGLGCKYEMNFELTRFSKPSVVSIPFGKNKPLYSQKDLFNVDGYCVFNGKKYLATDASMAIIDDHRGYYPYNSHYDWVSTMGYGTVNGAKKKFGFNLTRNQSNNQDDYNENLLWLEGETSRLTPIQFDHIEFNYWHVYDEHGMVDLYFDIGDRNRLKFQAGVASADYSICFGTLTGYVCDEAGNKYILDGMTGYGEDKSLRI